MEEGSVVPAQSSGGWSTQQNLEAGQTYGADAKTIKAGLSKERLTVDPKNADARIAIAAKAIEKGPDKRSFVAKFLDKVKYVTVDGEDGQKIAVNVGSLSRIGMSRKDAYMLALTGGLKEAIEDKSKETGERLTKFDQVTETLAGKYQNVNFADDKAKLTIENRQTGLTAGQVKKVAWIGTSVGEGGAIVALGHQRYMVSKVAGDQFDLNMAVLHDAKLLGEGSYGEVFRVTDISNVAVSAFKIAKTDNEIAHKAERDVKNENVILNYVHEGEPDLVGIQDAPHAAVHIKDVSALSGQTTLGHLKRIVGNLMPFYSLGTYSSAAKNMTPEQKVDTGIQLFTGLVTLKEKKVVLGDIKGDNILVRPDPKDPAKLQAHLADHGGARRLDRMPEPQEHRIGTYTAPYLSKKDELNIKNASNQASYEQAQNARDVFALGMTYFQGVTGKFPFSIDGAGRPKVKPFEERFTLEQRQKLFQGYDVAKMTEFFSGVLNPDPNQRWTAERAQDFLVTNQIVLPQR